MATNYTGDKTATQAPAPAALSLTDAILSLPQDADAWTIANFYQAMKTLADYTSVAQGFFFSLFGDGSDGSVTINTTVSLTRHMYYDTLVVQAGADLQTNGWRIYVRTSMAWTGGKISCNGAAGAAGVAGTGGTGGITWPGGIPAQRGPHQQGAGGGGGSGAVAGSQGEPCGPIFSSAASSNGPAGGLSTSSTIPGGSGTPRLPDPRSLFNFPYWQACATGVAPNGVALDHGKIWAYAGGVGGGGGGGATSFGGGGGGEGGGAIIIIAKSISFLGSPTCEVKGGAGGNAAGGNAGGGGGSDGGWAALIYGKISGSPPAVTATAGLAGTGAGTGASGSPGSAGNTTMQTKLVFG